MITKFLVLLTLILALQTPVVAGPYVDYDEISKWEIKGRYALGSNNTDLLAAYDLSYQNPLAIESIVRIKLGAFGLGDLNLRTVKRLIKKKLADRKGIDHKELKEISSELDEVELPALNKEWWRQVVWRNDGSQPKALANKEPVSFTLYDIDFEAMVKKKKRKDVVKALDKLASNFKRNELSYTPEDLFKRLRYQKIGEGKYELFLENPLRDDNRYRPEKVIDFRRTRNSFAREMGRQLTRKGLGELALLIPNGAGFLLHFGIERWYRLWRTQLSFQRYKALYHVTQAALWDGTGKKPLFSNLSEHQLEDAATFILSHETTVFKLLKSDTSRKNWWRRFLKVTERNIEDSVFWAKENFIEYTQPHPRYPWLAVTTQAHNAPFNRVYHFGSSVMFGARPLLALDNDNPDAIRFDRNLTLSVEALLILSRATIIKALYKYLAVIDIRNGIKWDGFLVAMLLENADEHQATIEKLYKQRINPFELTYAEETDFIEKSKAYVTNSLVPIKKL